MMRAMRSVLEAVHFTLAPAPCKIVVELLAMICRPPKEWAAGGLMNDSRAETEESAQWPFYYVSRT